MIPTQFEYERATSVEDALARLSAAGGDGKLLAGGHSLIPLMKLRLSEPGKLIDIARIPELEGIREESGRIVIGAMTTHHAIESSQLLKTECPVLAECAATIGDAQVRNKGTIGGSLAHADPSADLPAAVLALDATIHLQGPDGKRDVPADLFFQDLFTTDLREGEVLTAISFAPAEGSAYAKLPQKASHYALVGVAVVLEEQTQFIQTARVALTGATSYVQRLKNVEGALLNRPIRPDTFTNAAELAGEGLEAVNGDLHAGEEYRRAMIKVFTRRALESAAARL